MHAQTWVKNIDNMMILSDFDMVQKYKKIKNALNGTVEYIRP